MKTLSIRQPWAWLIVSGQKDVENRSWKTNFRGRILVHAPAKTDSMDGFEDSEATVTGAIIGSVEIIACVQDSPSNWAEPGQWHFILRNPVKFAEPIRGIPGRLSFWEFGFTERLERGHHDAL